MVDRRGRAQLAEDRQLARRSGRGEQIGREREVYPQHGVLDEERERGEEAVLEGGGEAAEELGAEGGGDAASENEGEQVRIKRQTIPNCRSLY